MTKKSIVIGSNGYLGRHLARELELKGWDNSNFDIQAVSPYQQAAYQRLDITRLEEIQAIDADVDTVFLFAGLTGTADGFDRFEEYIRVNEIGLLNVLTWLRENKSRARVLFPSTRLVYRGQEGRALAEDAEKEAKTIYAVNKLAAEHLLEMYGNAFDIEYTVLRICVPYGCTVGDSLSYGTLGFFLNKALKGENITLYGRGEVRRTFTHVSDIAANALRIAESRAASNHILNLGGEDLSLLEAARLVAVRFGVGVKFVDWPEMALKLESGDTVFDDQKLQTVVGACYEYSIASWIEGFEETQQ